MDVAKRVLIGLAFLMSPGEVRALPFDLIVPQTVKIKNSTTGVGSLVWGWILATSDTLTLADLVGASFGGSITGTPTVQFFDLLNPAAFAPLAPSEVAGGRTSQNASAFDPLLQTGETLKNPSFFFWQINFSFPFGFTGTETLTASISIGAHTADYSTSIEFGSFTETIKITSSQRLTAVPEPTVAGLLALGLCGLAAARTLLRRRDFETA